MVTLWLTYEFGIEWKSTKVQTLGELRMRDTANVMGWAMSMHGTHGLPLVARGESDMG